MWVAFDGPYGSKPFISTATALPDGTHTDWSAPQLLPNVNGTSADTYLLPHVDPSGTVWTSVTNFPSAQQRPTYNNWIDFSIDGGKTWQGPLPATGDITMGPYVYPNTTIDSAPSTASIRSSTRRTPAARPAGRPSSATTSATPAPARRAIRASSAPTTLGATSTTTSSS